MKGSVGRAEVWEGGRGGLCCGGCDGGRGERGWKGGRVGGLEPRIVLQSDAIRSEQLSSWTALT